MSSLDFKPVNRHLQLRIKEEQKKTRAGVLLPDAFSRDTEKYQIAEVLAVADDCKEVFIQAEGKRVYVERSMVETLNIAGLEVKLVLENYVIGVLS